MRKIIISFCILFAALSLQAQSVNGIRIDGCNAPTIYQLVHYTLFVAGGRCFHVFSVLRQIWW